jgi:hypothetical protein
MTVPFGADDRLEGEALVPLGQSMLGLRGAKEVELRHGWSVV